MNTRRHSTRGTIGFRIFIAFFCIFFLVIIQGTLALYSSRKVVEAQRTAYTTQLKLLTFRDKLAHLRIKMFMLLGTQSPTRMEALRTEVEHLLEEIPEESQALNMQSEAFASSQETYQQVIALHWDFRTTQAYDWINSTSEEEYATLSEALDTRRSSIEMTMQETIRRTNKQFVSITILLCVVGLLIVVLWGWYLRRSIADPIKQAVRYAQMIADGDLSMQITVRKHDETGQLLIAFTTMISRLKAMSTEIETLIHAVQAGNLTLRGNAEAFVGDWRTLIEGINVVLEAFMTPLTMTADSLEQIARGDIPEVITEEYHGDFNHIKDHLNALIEAMQAITELAQEMAAGNLAVTVKERSEHDTLMQALNTMIHRLREVVIHVQSAAKNVALSSQEMSSSAEQLSQGATEQAASTEQASSSLEEMAVNVKQNADNAIQTEKMARRTAEDAHDGGQAVTQTVAAMKEIVEKILIIQEIAQETRMLSLNASIEASRASEAGKAFSTIASEVRQLATTTKTAAEAIKHLSDSSVAIAERSGEMLGKIVPNSQKTAEFVQEISAASSEQSLGFNQMNQVIYQLDQVTQKNASTAEEVAAMAEQLASQSTQLQRAVEFFQLKETVFQEKEDSEPSAPPSAESGEHTLPGGKTPETRPLSASKSDQKFPVTMMNQTEREDLDIQEGVDDRDDDFERY